MSTLPAPISPIGAHKFTVELYLGAGGSRRAYPEGAFPSLAEAKIWAAKKLAADRRIVFAEVIETVLTERTALVVAHHLVQRRGD